MSISCHFQNTRVGARNRWLSLFGADKLTQGPGQALHTRESTNQKCVICLHLESYLQKYSAYGSLFQTKNKLTCQCPLKESSKPGYVAPWT